MRTAMVALASVAVAFAAGCSSSGSDLLSGGAANRPAYAGPLFVPVGSAADDATVAERAGAAARALECRFTSYGGGVGDYSDGLDEVRSSFADSASGFIGPASDGQLLPTGGYRVERRSGTRVLLSFDVGGRTKAAIIVRNGVRDYRHHVGWGVETWAVCDPAEYPKHVTDRLGIGVWLDRHGGRVPIAQVESLPGKNFCDNPGTEWVQVGNPQHPAVFVRDPKHELTTSLRARYDGAARLPADAKDSGFHREHGELWVSPRGGAAYLVSGDRTVELWPRFRSAQFGCG